MIRTKFQIILIIAVILVVFYPTFNAELCWIDDVEVLGHYHNITSWSFRQIFVPEVSGGLYYRPLIHLSFIISKAVHALEPVWLHLENIFLHVVNAVLIFWLIRNAIHKDDREKSYLPLSTSLLFALHPINTEAVNWISARTDLLAGTFVIASAVCILKFREKAQWKYLTVSLLLFFMAMLSKEIAIAFLFGILLLSFARPSRNDNAVELRLSTASPISRYVATGLLSIGAVVGVIFMRYLAFTSNYGKIGLTLKFIFNDLPYAFRICMRSFGFYIKKIFIPYPLNMAIMGVDPLYELLAIPLLIFCIYLIRRKTLISAFFLTGAILITPSFVIAFGQIAWTAYAERYLYIPSAFIVSACSLYLRHHVSSMRHEIRRGLIIAILLIMALGTFQRNLIWQKNDTLLKDTAEKSAWSKDVQILYGFILAKQGNYDDAIKQASKADAIMRIDYDERSDLLRAYVAYQLSQFDEAVKLYEKVLKNTKYLSMDALENLVEIYKKKVKSSSNNEVRKANIDKLSEYSLKLFELNKDPLILYDMAKIYNKYGDEDVALRYFRKALILMKPDFDYRPIIMKHIAHLEKNGNR